jgi:hypothetical protein
MTDMGMDHGIPDGGETCVYVCNRGVAEPARARTCASVPIGVKTTYIPTQTYKVGVPRQK